MKKIIIYYGFIITTFMVVAGFFGAKSYPEIISAILFFPLGLYFGMLVVPKKGRAITITREAPLTSAKLEAEGKYDPERRRFLRIIGTAGTSLFLLSVFTRKAEAAFFGSVPGPGTVALKDTAGAQIDPAEKSPTDGYNINQVDDTSSDTYSYYGFTNKGGAWFIMRETTSGVNVGQYRYRIGSSGFPTGWSARADNPDTYDYFDQVF